MSTKRLVTRAGKVGAVVAAAGMAMLLVPGIASAHVTARVVGEAAMQGQAATKVMYRVPNESNANSENSANLVKFTINLPKETPLTFVRAMPSPGWKVDFTKTQLDKPVDSHGTPISELITSVTWTAEGTTKIGPGEFNEFQLFIGELPKAEKLVTPAEQTYDSGKILVWDQPEGAPALVAPFIKLAPAGSTTASGASAITPEDSDHTARWLGGAGLAVGVIGLGLGGVATLRARRNATA